MRLVLENERRLRVLAEGMTLEIESTDPSVTFSPLHMLAASLATCTVSVLAEWAAAAGLDIAGLEITIAWDYVEDPYRVGGYDMKIHWPGLPEPRREAAVRAARNCTVEHTLTHPPVIDLAVDG